MDGNEEDGHLVKTIGSLSVNPTPEPTLPVKYVK